MFNLQPHLIIQRSPLPTCPDDCGDNSAPVSFDECAPEIHEGQIAKVYITNIGNPLTDWTDAVEWGLRLDDTASAADSILTLHVIGDKPIPTSDPKEISLGRKVIGNKEHLINIAVDETNDTNHEFMRTNECSGQWTMWYETLEGLLFGGTEGIKGSLLLDMVIPESDSDLVLFTGTFDWKSKFTEERILSPI